MLLLIMALAVCVAATIFQFAVYRSPDVQDKFLAHTGRRLSIVGSVLAVLYLAHGLLTGEDTPRVASLILMLYGLSQSLFAVRDLYPQFDKEHPKWTSRLNSSH